MSHKQDLIADLEEVFDDDVLAEYVTFDGRKHTKVIITTDTVGNTSTAQDTDLRTAGLANTTKTVFVKTADVPRTYKRGEHFFMDGEYYKILQVSEEHGQLRFTLSATENREGTNRNRILLED